MEPTEQCIDLSVGAANDDDDDDVTWDVPMSVKYSQCNAGDVCVYGGGTCMH